ncbi:hypothetical protein DLJ53_02700 [Acuticoccus sediminis]|uniref:FAR-17a/AIG1-like protein n=1 Tax=Acuticoccus sediminis TaxID=2184697 RepID=A0A8B2NTA1_9HYPH|nr:Pr6Pr family membrane protein [Acuticoccus sediminis]RAI03437.1 hypothetical protein DLJ53_02700 [Acuticoccus sediminis]
MPGRLLAGLAAAVAATAVILQFVATTWNFAAEGKTALDALWRLAGFFTIWGNIAVALVGGTVALRPARWFADARVRLATLSAIIIVGLVYAVLLRYQLQQSHGLQRFASHLLHDVVPPLFTVAWIAGRHGRLALRDALWAIVLPGVYLVYVLFRSTLGGFEPYWFLDLATLGPALYARNAAGLAFAFAAMGLLVVLADRGLGRLAQHPSSG